jgi:thymidylate kinase
MSARPAAPVVHPALDELFRAWDERQVEWTLLRLPSRLDAPEGDVDVLVDARRAADARAAAEDLGFVALPGWDAAPNLILFLYDRRSDRWLVVDAVTVVSFARERILLLGVAGCLLARRRRAGAVWVPADDDRFWLLLLHCMLDRGAIPVTYRPELRALARMPVGDSPAVLALPGWGRQTRSELAAAAARGDWALLERRAAPLLTRSRRRSPLRARWSGVRLRARRLAAKPGLLRRRRGLNVALLGANGAGKSTLAAQLRGRLPVPAELVYMGLWHDSGAGLDAARRPLRAWRGYARAQLHQLRGRVVIFDRYVSDARIPPTPPLVALKRPYLWMLARACPAPDLAVLLDVPPEAAYDRKAENPLAELADERRHHRRIITELPRGAVVDAAQPADAVRADVTELVWKRLASHWRAGGVSPNSRPHGPGAVSR